MQRLNKHTIILIKLLFYSIAGSLIFISINFIFQIYYDYPEEYNLLQHIGTIILTALITEGLLFINKRFKKSKIISKRRSLRILVQLISNLAFVLILVSASSIFIMLAFASDNKVIITWFDLIITNLVAIFYSFTILLAISLYETNKNLRDSLLKMEKFKKERAEAKFHSLKKQLSPHFLFNTLNTLYGIIDKNNQLAKDYLLKISEIYRYVLENENNELIELKKELDFAKSFAFLLNKRFGDTFYLEVRVPEKLLNKHIPPLTLQMLVENALKHNKMDLKNRLTLSISGENDNELIIRNNIMARNIHENTTGLGLQNLNNRYKYLNNKEISIDNNGANFIVKIPLLNVEGYESIDS